MDTMFQFKDTIYKVSKNRENILLSDDDFSLYKEIVDEYVQSKDIKITEKIIMFLSSRNLDIDHEYTRTFWDGYCLNFERVVTMYFSDIVTSVPCENLFAEFYQLALLVGPSATLEELYSAMQNIIMRWEDMITGKVNRKYLAVYCKLHDYIMYRIKYFLELSPKENLENPCLLKDILELFDELNKDMTDPIRISDERIELIKKIM